MPVQNRFISIGEEAPDFSLNSVAGESITLSQYRNKKNVVIVFLRGFL